MKSNGIPVRLTAEQIALLDSIGAQTGHTRSHLIIAAVHLALSRAEKGDIQWILRRDTESKERTWPHQLNEEPEPYVAKRRQKRAS